MYFFRSWNSLFIVMITVIWIQEFIQIEAAIVSKSGTNQHKHIDEDDNNWFSLKSGEVLNENTAADTRGCRKEGKCRSKRNSEAAELFENAFGKLGNINAVFAFANFVLNKKHEGALTDEMKQSFDRMGSRMQSIDTSLHKLLAEEALNDRFFQYEEVILKSVRRAKDYLKAAKDTTQTMVNTTKSDLISAAEKLDDCINTIFNGLLNKHSFASDILRSTMNKNQRHLVKFKRDCDKYLTLIRLGTFALMVYFYATGTKYPPNRRKERIEELAILERRAKERIALFEEKCKNEKNVVKEMRDIMANSHMKTIDGILDSLYEYLADKYSTKNWFVMVYKNIINDSDREKMDPAFHLVVGERGYNAAAISFKESCKFQRNSLLQSNLDSYCKRGASTFSTKSRLVKQSYFNPVWWLVSPFNSYATCFHYKAHIMYRQLKDFDSTLLDAKIAVVVAENDELRSACVESVDSARYFGGNQVEGTNIYAFLCN